MTLNSDKHLIISIIMYEGLTAALLLEGSIRGVFRVTPDTSSEEPNIQNVVTLTTNRCSNVILPYICTTLIFIFPDQLFYLIR